jgi:hypothetical protein
MTDLRQAAMQALDALRGADAIDTDMQDAIYTLYEALEQPQQEQMRMPKAGDKVICLEDESIGTIVSLTAGGSPDITFDDGSRGTYMLREFAELFGYVTPPAAQPEQEPTCPRCGHVCSQRPWQGLTDDEITEIYEMGLGVRASIETALDKIEERNNG